MTFQEDTLVNTVLAAIQDQLSSAEKPTSYLQQHAQHTLQFFQAIDWSQHWLIGLLTFHILCFILVILLRHRHTALSCYFFVLLGLAALTQPLNQAGAIYWEQFAEANYFDDSGLFIVSLYAFPLIFNGFFCLVFILKASFKLMVEMKRRQLQQKAKKSKKE
ncbi:transmembrane protein 18-domain-containing protein [Halteromyces radiatus]|uniref:transmembrane protein 18-domain-containing protein n=1 Tax=Halteromyces radiatus TaxID=101107 RepID=UPI002220E3A2|nr:transmembrane protein 18-domain-containing protein [Halteromyces radiatus]KAI8084977.1 transmembrane protein 18-domain-containing protein [Halteromyces radiatus]